MNDWDRDNLKFLLKADSACLKEWYEQSDADDRAYAQELLTAYNNELDETEATQLIEKSLELRSEFTEARSVLDKFRL